MTICRLFLVGGEWAMRHLWQEWGEQEGRGGKESEVGVGREGRGRGRRGGEGGGDE